MTTLGERLREERERLGWSQSVLAERTEATKKTVFSWETGKTSPTGFQLSAMADAGADVAYILTGVRTVRDLSPSEAALLDHYRNCSPDKQNCLEEVGLALAQRSRQSVRGEAA